MKEAIIKLLKIKSLITIAVTIVFVYLALTDKLEIAQTMTIITMILTYYFTKNTNTKEDNEKE